MTLALPPFILLIPYGLFLLATGFFGLINVVHLFRYGARNLTGFLATFGYLSGFAFILFMTWQYLPDVVWTESVELFATAAKFPY